MPTYSGFSTLKAGMPKPSTFQQGIDGNSNKVNLTGYGKKFRLTDEQLVIQDFLNSLNIPMGQKPGQPSYGTSLWGFIFEPNVPDIQVQIQNEVRRMASMDPRIQLGTVAAYPQDNGILLEVEMAIAPFNDAKTLSIYFDQSASKAFGV